MKYTTKRSKVEEVTIDLEDGCILKITKDNVFELYTVPHNIRKTKTINGITTSFKYCVVLILTNGITFELSTSDLKLYNDLFSLVRGE